MPPQDRIEIVSPSGEVKFIDLNPAKGIINIGRDLTNDVRLDSPEVAPFQAIIDHRKVPHQVLLLNDQLPSRLGADALPANQFVDINYWQTISLGGYTLILLPGEAVPTTQAAAPAQPAAPAYAGDVAPVTDITGVPTVQFRPPDRSDDTIIVELAEREAIIDVEKTAVFSVTVANGGAIVAAFDLRVDGLEPGWVAILPNRVNLVEGERTTVSVTITPPRSPTSSAGAHHFAIVVDSPNYPGRSSIRGATLTINPFFEFSVGELFHRQLRTTWFKRSAETAIPITNKSNTQTIFRLDSADDERALRYEFKVPGEEAALATQAEFRLPANGNIFLPILISPHKGTVVSLRSRVHPFTIGVSQLGGTQSQRSVSGQLVNRPLFGLGSILLAVLMLLILIYLAFKPRVNFAFDQEGDSARQRIIPAGQVMMLNWKVWPPVPWSEVSLNGEVLVDNKKEVRLVQSTTFELVANTWLSRFIPVLAARDQFIVEVDPTLPLILLFDAQPQRVVQGNKYILSWAVLNADTLTLVNQTAGVEENIPANGSREITADKTTIYVLRAINDSRPDFKVEQPLEIVVSPPITPLPPPPYVRTFELSRNSIKAGESITVTWAVSNVATVDISPIGTGLPPMGAVKQSPAENTVYVLTASNASGVQSQVQEVAVAAAGGPAEAPAVDIFKVTPTEGTVVTGQSLNVRVEWLVSGKTTDIQLHIGSLGANVLSKQPAQGNQIFAIKETTQFVLVAKNADKQTVKTAEVKLTVITPTPTNTATATATPTPTNTPTPSLTPTVTRTPTITPPVPPTLTPTNTPTPTRTPLPPVLSYFKALPRDGNDQVTIVKTTDPYTYTVGLGSDVRLTWDTTNVITVSLEISGTKYIGPPQGVYDIPYFTFQNTQTYTLTVANSSGAILSRILLFPVEAKPPAPPYNVQGTVVNSSTSQVTWYYNRPDTITSFRLYRQSLPTPAPSAVLVTEVPSLPPLVTYSATDTAAQNCSYYYVVAVWNKLAWIGNVLTSTLTETEKSTNFWYTPCP